MKHTYKINGMTCGSCKASVEEQLKIIKDVEGVEVNLALGEAEILMKEHVPMAILKEALAPKYQISEIKDKEERFMENDTENTSKLAQLKPLFLILTYITVASILMHRNTWDWNAFMLDFMGLFFIVFSFFKMLDLKGFPDSFSMYDPLAKKLPFYAKAYPFIETVLGLMFLMRFEIFIALVLTLVVLGITTIGVVKILIDKKSIRCACLGTVLKLPMTEATFIENAIMLIMSVLMLMNI